MSLVSSMKLLVLHFCGIKERLFVYILNISGPKILPRGTALVTGKGSDSVEWIHTTSFMLLR